MKIRFPADVYLNIITLSLTVDRVFAWLTIG